MPRAHRSTLLALFAAAALVGVFFGALAATPATTRASRLAGISGPGISGIQIVNFSPTSTMVATLDLYKQTGAAPIPIIRSGIAPSGGGANIYLPAESSLTNGAYAGILSSDQPHGAIARTDWTNTGGAVMVEQATAAVDAFIPLVYKQYAGQTSMVSIQNTDTSDLALVNIEVRAAGSATVVADSQVNIAPGTSVTLDLAKNASFQALPQGFVGTMHVSSQRPEQLIAVNAIVDVETSPRAVYAFGGDAGDAAAVFVPRFRVEDPAFEADVPAEHTTLIAVANPGAAAGDFRLTYTGMGGGCAGQTVVHGNHDYTIPAGSNLLFDSGPGGANLATGPSGLPSGCFGTAKVEVISSDPNVPNAGARVAAVVIDMQRDADDQTITAAGAYNAFKAADVTHSAITPLFRSQHTGVKMSTEVTVMNLGAAPAEVQLWGTDFVNGPASAVVAPNASHTFRAEDTSMRDGSFGSAVIESVQPIVAVVDDISRAGSQDMSSFRAIRAALPPDRTGHSHSALPLLFQRNGSSATTPSPAPTSDVGATVDIFAIGFVDVTGGADPACPGCDGQYDPADEQHASQHPLPSLTFVLRDDQGQEVSRATTIQLATLQRGLLRAPELTGSHFYTLELVGNPQGYQLCGNDVRSRQLTVDDFQLGSTREDFHFNTSSCVPDPNITPPPSPTPAASSTPYPPGTQPLTIFAIGFVDVFGGSDPNCPGCDGVYQLQDETFAVEHPLPRLTFLVRDGAGREIARKVSEGLATLQRTEIRVPPLANGDSYTLELLENPGGWQLCGNEPRSRKLTLNDFQLDSTREDFHFNTNQCSPWPTATVPSQTVVHRYSPSDDSRVASASPDSNYGDTTYLRVRQAEGDEHRTYLMFNVENLAAPIVRAKIRLFAYDYGVAGTAAASVHVNWAEDTITWNNAPALGALLDSAGPVAFSAWVEYNVTSVIHPGNGTYAFAIVGNSQDSMYFRSKEYAGSRPELVIETAAEVLPTATPASPAPVAGPKGRAVTGVSVVNLDPASTGDIQAVIKHQETGASMTVARPNISPQGSTHVFLPSESGVIRGLFAGLVNSDVPVRAIVNNYWLDEHASAYSEDAVPAADVLVPLVVKGAEGQNSLVTIQNYDTTTATDVEIKLSDTAGQVVATVTRSVAPGASITLDIGRDPAFLNVPLGFVGSLRARAALRIAAQAIVDVEHSPMAVYGFQGEPAVAASASLFVPRALAGVPVDPDKPEAGLRMTRIAAANPGTSAIAVTLTFAGADGTCGATAPAPIGPASIAAGGMRLFDLPAEGLPAGCTAAVRIDATGGGVLAVVVDTVEAGQFVRTAGAYNAFTATQGGTRTLLPVVRKRHVDGRISTDIAVMNVSSDPAAVTLSVKDHMGRSIDCPAACEAVVAPGTTHTFVPESISAWQAGTYGSAVVESDQPVVVTVTDESRILNYDTGIYRGAAVALTPSDIAPSALALPLLANQAQIRLDGPALTPPDPGWINLPSLVEPLHTLFLPLVGSLLGEPLHR